MTIAFLQGANLDSLRIHGYSINFRVTTMQFRDPSAWYHIVVAIDTTNPTPANRIKFYVNGSEITSFTISSDLTLNADYGINQALQHGIGRYEDTSSSYFNGYLTEINFIDGQALTPSSFGQTDAVTGRWKAKAYSGTYGTNGFYLKFADNSSTAALGTDSSGNGNTWTTNNFSVTAGAGNDSLVDSPTNYGKDTGVGGEVRGNYCVINQLDSSSASNTTANGNLDVTITSSASIRGSFYVSTGKWYYEVTVNTLRNLYLGLAGNGGRPTGYTNTSAFGVNNAGDFFENNALQTEDSIALAAGSVYGIAFDADAKKFWIAKNGQWYSCDQTPDITISESDILAGNYGYDFSTLTGDSFSPHFGNSTTAGANISANFGQRPFAYTAPTGFKALCTTNLIKATAITTSGSFIGNVSANGPFVYLNGIPTAMTINGNAVTFGSQADKLSNGFKVRTTSTSYNSTGTNNFSVSTTAQKFKYARAQAN
jgi:hypothetical protein